MFWAVIVASTACGGVREHARGPAAPGDQGTRDGRAPVAAVNTASDAGAPSESLACVESEHSWPAVEQAAKLRQAMQALGAKVSSSSEWADLAAMGLTGRPGARPVAVHFNEAGASDPLVTYYLVPWQPLATVDSRDEFAALTTPLLTVTAHALVFGPVSASSAAPDDVTLRAEVEQAVSRALDMAANQAELPAELAKPVPSSVQVLSLHVRRHCVTLAVALPGTHLPTDDVLEELAPGRMLELVLIPDIGPRRVRWLAPRQRPRSAEATEKVVITPELVPTGCTPTGP
jgi:hypothetical protein